MPRSRAQLRPFVGPCAALLVVALVSPLDATLPPGFERDLIASPLDEPLALAFAPDGRLFIAQRNGVIRVWQAGVLATSPLVSIPVDTQNGERGLVGLELDPNFAVNGFLYAYFTTLEPRNRVARFTVIGAAAALTSELVLWENPELAADYHHGGALRFGADGRLYITTGDQFDAGSSQDLSRLHGKLLRIDSDGSVPATNPFVGVAGAAPEIYARGLRNPFRMSFDDVSGALYIGDVGGNGSNSVEEINVAANGANYGWPNQEGPFCYVSDCSAITFPNYSYAHDDPDYFVDFNQACIVMGPRYRGAAFPAEYQGNLFIGDYANRWIRRVILSAAGVVLADPLFDTAPSSGTIADLIEGPDGALYYVTVGVPWSGSPDIGAVWRIRYAGAGNQPPVVAAGATPTQGAAPLNVAFSSAGSFDPDAGPGPLTFAWSFGDGATSTLPNPSHVYVSNGAYAAELTVSDGAAATMSAPIAITVGAAPVGEITAPPPGTTYRAGDVIAFAGTASDLEDGVLGATAFTWSIVLVHESHAHPFAGPIIGVSSGSFTIPTTGHSPENTYFEIELTVSDSDGLSQESSRAITPVIAELALDTQPSGIPIFLDGQPELTPRCYESIPGFNHTVTAQSAYVLGGEDYTFSGWSDGGSITHAFVMPEAGLTLTAQYVRSGSALFRRTDCNGDGALDIADAVFLLSYLFSAGSAPACADACDGNDDGLENIGDPISMLSALFGGSAPPAPYPGCGADATPGDPLACTSYGACP